MTDYTFRSRNQDAPTASGDQNVPGLPDGGAPIPYAQGVPPDPGFIDLSEKARAVANQYRVRSYDADDQGAYDKPPLDSH